MRLILHIVRKDLRRLKWLFAAWAVWVSAPLVCAFLNRLLGDADLSLRTTLLQVGFYDNWFSMFFIYAMVALVIQQDPAAGPSNFWVTRPISPGMALKAKGLLIGTSFVAIPLGFEALTLLLQGVTIHDTLIALVGQFFIQLVLVFESAVPAVLTPHFGAFVPVMAGVWYCYSWVIFPMYLVKSLDPSVIPTYAPYSAGDSIYFVATLMIIFLGAALIYLQYRTRNTRRTALLAILAYLSLGLPELTWRWDFMADPQPPVDRQALDTDRVKVAIGKHAVWLGTGDWAYPRPMADYSGEVTIEGAGRGQEIRLVDMRGQMTLPDGQVVRDYGWDYKPKLDWCDTADARAVQGALGDIRLMNPRMGRSNIPPLMRLDQKLYRQFEKQDAVFQADMRFTLFQYKPEAEIALATGAGFRQGSQSVTVMEITPQTYGINVKLQMEDVHTPFGHDPRIKRDWIFEEDNVVYVLVNPKYKQAFLCNPLDTYLLVGQFQALQPLRLHREVLQFTGNKGKEDKDLPKLDEDWLKDAFLERLRLEPLGTFDKTIVMKDFPVAGNGGKFGSPEKWGIYFIKGIPTRYNE